MGDVRLTLGVSQTFEQLLPGGGESDNGSSSGFTSPS